jgi:hypothetical protein
MRSVMDFPHRAEYAGRLIPLLPSKLPLADIERYDRLSSCELRSVVSLSPGTIYALLLAGLADPAHPTALLQCTTMVYGISKGVPAFWYGAVDCLVSYWCRGFEGAVRVAAAVLYAFALPLDVTRAPRWEDFRVEELVNVEPERIVLAVALRQLLDGGSIAAVGTAPAAVARRAVYAAGPEHGLSDDVNMTLLAAHVVLGVKGADTIARLRRECCAMAPEKRLAHLAVAIGSWSEQHFETSQRGSLALLKKLVDQNARGLLPLRPRRLLVTPHDPNYLPKLLEDSLPLREVASHHQQFFDVFREMVHQASDRMQSAFNSFTSFRSRAVEGRWRDAVNGITNTKYGNVDCAGLLMKECRDLRRDTLIGPEPVIPVLVGVADGLLEVLSQCDVDAHVPLLLAQFPRSVLCSSKFFLSTIRIRACGLTDDVAMTLFDSVDWHLLQVVDLAFNRLTDQSNVGTGKSHYMHGPHTCGAETHSRSHRGLQLLLRCELVVLRRASSGKLRSFRNST